MEKNCDKLLLTFKSNLSLQNVWLITWYQYIYPYKFRFLNCVLVRHRWKSVFQTEMTLTFGLRRSILHLRIEIWGNEHLYSLFSVPCSKNMRMANHILHRNKEEKHFNDLRWPWPLTLGYEIFTKIFVLLCEPYVCTNWTVFEHFLLMKITLKFTRSWPWPLNLKTETILIWLNSDIFYI